jgi:hypothetical protein
MEFYYFSKNYINKNQGEEQVPTIDSRLLDAYLHNRKVLHNNSYKTVLKSNSWIDKMIPLLAVEAHGVRGGIAPNHS